MRTTLCSLVFAGLLLSATPAAAQAIAAPQAADLQAIASKYDLDGILRQIIGENLRRVRRGVVLGPHLGANGSYIGQESKLDGAISGGLGFYYFSIPLTLEAPASAIDSLKRRAAERLKQMIDTGKAPSADEAAAIVRQVFDEMKDEFLGKTPYRPSTFEKPRAGVYFDLSRVLGAGDTQLRLTPSFAVSYVNVGVILGATLGRHDGLLLGGELSVRALPGDGLRSNMIDIFLREELMFDRYDGKFHTLNVHTLGLRATLDLL